MITQSFMSKIFSQFNYQTMDCISLKELFLQASLLCVYLRFAWINPFFTQTPTVSNSLVQTVKYFFACSCSNETKKEQTVF